MKIIRNPKTMFRIQVMDVFLLFRLSIIKIIGSTLPSVLGDHVSNPGGGIKTIPLLFLSRDLMNSSMFGGMSTYQS